MIPCQIKVPTWEDYKSVPKTYEVGKPLLSWEKLQKVPNNVKRMHDWYMRASAAGIHAINVSIPHKAFQSDYNLSVITFEDIWLMMNLERLDVQIITMFAL